MAMTGGFLSTLFGPSGPRLVLLPATSKTVRLFVKALAVSVFAATEVVRLKLASAELASPEYVSPAAQASDTFVACHIPSGEAHDAYATMSSKHTGPYVLSAVVPPLSQVLTWTVWQPSPPLAPFSPTDPLAASGEAGPA